MNFSSDCNFSGLGIFSFDFNDDIIYNVLINLLQVIFLKKLKILCAFLSSVLVFLTVILAYLIVNREGDSVDIFKYYESSEAIYFKKHGHNCHSQFD